MAAESCRFREFGAGINPVVKKSSDVEQMPAKTCRGWELSSVAWTLWKAIFRECLHNLKIFQKIADQHLRLFSGVASISYSAGYLTMAAKTKRGKTLAEQIAELEDPTPKGRKTLNPDCVYCGRTNAFLAVRF
jgi:hypothetical protein